MHFLKAFYWPMIDSFIEEHNEAASQISEVYSSRGRSYLNIIIEYRCYSYSFYVRPWTYWTNLVYLLKYSQEISRVSIIPTSCLYRKNLWQQVQWYLWNRVLYVTLESEIKFILAHYGLIALMEGRNSIVRKNTRSTLLCVEHRFCQYKSDTCTA